MVWRKRSGLPAWPRGFERVGDRVRGGAILDIEPSFHRRRAPQEAFHVEHGGAVAGGGVLDEGGPGGIQDVDLGLDLGEEDRFLVADDLGDVAAEGTCRVAPLVAQSRTAGFCRPHRNVLAGGRPIHSPHEPFGNRNPKSPAVGVGRAPGATANGARPAAGSTRAPGAKTCRSTSIRVLRWEDVGGMLSRRVSTGKAGWGVGKAEGWKTKDEGGSCRRLRNEVMSSDMSFILPRHGAARAASSLLTNRCVAIRSKSHGRNSPQFPQDRPVDGDGVRPRIFNLAACAQTREATGRGRYNPTLHAT